MRKGGLNFPNFAITVKALRLSWIGRLLEKKTIVVMHGKLFQMPFSKSMEVSTPYSSAITIQRSWTKVYRYST